MSKFLTCCAIALALVLIPLSAATAQTPSPAIQVPQANVVPAPSTDGQIQGQAVPGQDLILGQKPIETVYWGCLDSGVPCPSTEFCQTYVSENTECIAIDFQDEPTCQNCPYGVPGT